MPEENKDANTVVDQDTVMDKVLDDIEASSASKEGAETTEGQETGADQSKNANLDKEVGEVSGMEEKLSKIAEILGDDKEAIDAYIKSKGYHKDPAWQKLLEKSRTPVIDEDTKRQLEDFKNITSSREYIEASMKAKGYTEEAIGRELQNRGFQIQPKTQDDVELVVKSLGLDPKTMDENTRAVIGDISKITDVILKDRLGRILPEVLNPITKNLSERNQQEGGKEITSRMVEVVKKEDILDFEKDIGPKLDEWLDKNPKATQPEIFEYFTSLNHSLSIERLKTGKKREETAGKKGNLRQNVRSPATRGEVPKKTGDYDKDADVFLDSIGAPA